MGVNEFKGASRVYKIITSDLDETLLRQDGSISSANVAAIAAASKRGVKFVPNTGRSFLSIQPLLKTLNLYQRPNEYVVSYNGGVVVENQDNRVIVSNEMPYEEAAKAFAIMSEFDVDIHIYTLDHLFIYRPRADDCAYLQTRGVTFTEMTGAFDQFRNAQIMKVIVMNPDVTVRQRVYAAIKAAFTEINCTYSSGIYMEVNHAGVDKGRAILDLGDKLGIKADEIMAIGDNANDLGMLTKVGLPVSVANGIDDVKQVAKFVTPHDYERGVADAIETFIL